jgi:hypothetical protein
MKGIDRFQTLPATDRRREYSEAAGLFIGPMPGHDHSIQLQNLLLEITSPGSTSSYPPARIKPALPQSSAWAVRVGTSRLCQIAASATLTRSPRRRERVGSQEHQGRAQVDHQFEFCRSLHHSRLRDERSKPLRAHDVAAVRMQHLTAHIGRFLAGKKDVAGGYFVGLSWALHGHACAVLGYALRLE